MTTLEVPSVLRIDFGREGIRVALLGGADGFVAHVRELRRVLAVDAFAVAAAHHQCREALAVPALNRGKGYVHAHDIRTAVSTHNLRHFDFLQLHPF